MINIIDLEATCWYDHEVPDGQRNEIISIGICTFEEGEIIPCETIYIRPIQSEVSGFCKELTGLSAGYLAHHGIKWKEACEKMRSEYDSTYRPWASWGNWDRDQINSEDEHKDGMFPVSRDHLNIRTLFKERYGEGCKLEGACEHLDLKMIGDKHEAIDDAHNAARVLGEILYG